MILLHVQLIHDTLKHSVLINTYSFLDAVMGKVEGEGDLWHGHVTAVTVAPEYRRQQLARKLMDLLEEITHKT